MLDTYPIVIQPLVAVDKIHISLRPILWSSFRMLADAQKLLSDFLCHFKPPLATSRIHVFHKFDVRFL